MNTRELDRISAEIALLAADALVLAVPDSPRRRPPAGLTATLRCIRDLAETLPGTVHYHDATGEEDTPCACGNPFTYTCIEPDVTQDTQPVVHTA
jgi:hypothetical protein